MGIVDRLDQQTIGTLKLLNNCLGEVSEVNLGVLVVDVFCKLGNALGIGLGLEMEALVLKKSLKFLVVGNDTIVDDRKLPVGVRTISY